MVTVSNYLFFPTFADALCGGKQNVKIFKHLTIKFQASQFRRLISSSSAWIFIAKAYYTSQIQKRYSISFVGKLLLIVCGFFLLYSCLLLLRVNFFCRFILLVFLLTIVMSYELNVIVFCSNTTLQCFCTQSQLSELMCILGWILRNAILLDGDLCCYMHLVASSTIKL